MNQDFIEAISLSAARIPGPRTILWPDRGKPGAMRTFATFEAWRDFVIALGVRDTIPLIITTKFVRAQKLHLLAWIDFNLIKIGELVALTTLELALKDRYGDRVKKNKRGEYKFADLISFMIRQDGLTDEKIPMVQRYGGSVIPILTGDRKPSLSEIRNSLAHGDPFDGMPWPGMIELVRDLIEYSYRDWL